MQEDRFRTIIDYTAMQCRDHFEEIELKKIRSTLVEHCPPHDADEKTKENFRRLVKIAKEHFVKRFDPISDTARELFKQYLEDE